MLPVTPLPAAGEVFLDTRGSGRVLRVSWHHPGRPHADPLQQADAGPEGHPLPLSQRSTSTPDMVVLSLWHGDTCSGSFRLPAADVPALVSALRDGLARAGLPPSEFRSARADGLTG